MCTRKAAQRNGQQRGPRRHQGSNNENVDTGDVLQPGGVDVGTVLQSNQGGPAMQ